MATPRPRRRQRDKAPPATRTADLPAAEPVFRPVGSAPTTRLPRAPRGDEPRIEVPRVGRFPREALAPLVLLTVVAYVAGWYVAYTGVLPLFLASDLGLVTMMALALRTVGRVVRARVLADGLGIPAAAIPKAFGWGLATFWFFLALTNAWQLSVGVGGGIVLYQLFASRARIRREGYGHATRFGPAFAPSILVTVSYLGWYAARQAFGAAPGFDLGSAIVGAIVTIVALRIADGRARTAAAAIPRVHDKDTLAVRRDLERRVIIAVVAGYLFFRVFISTAIPYGPIVEWLLVCLGALFIAIIMADRIGTVSTRRSIPQHDVRTHIQRIHALPDRDLESDEEHIAAFLHRGAEIAWLHDRFVHLLEEAGIAAPERDALLEPLRVPEGKRRRHAPAESYGLEAREQLVSDLVTALRRRRREGATGTLKSAPGLRHDRDPDPGADPVARPSVRS